MHLSLEHPKTPMYPENLPENKPQKYQKQFSQIAIIPHRPINNKSQPKMVFIQHKDSKSTAVSMGQGIKFHFFPTIVLSNFRSKERMKD
jgi:hypothetical protein